jgi:hypothetical protein
MPLEEAGRPLPRVSVRENAERAEALVWALSTTINQDIDRLQPEKQSEIKFLEAVSEILDNLASAINEATHATTSQDRERKFAKVDTLAGNLAKAAREFAEVNSERVVDYGGYSELVILRTELFANMFGVPASVVRSKRHSSPSLDYLTENLAALFHDRR